MIVKHLRKGGLAFFLSLFALTLLAAGPQTLHGHVPEIVAHMKPLGRLPETNRLDLAISLPLRNQAALSNLLSQIYDPASPNYHHYLTPEQFTEQFGPTENDYKAVIAYAKANGLRVTTTWPNRLLLDVSGTADQVERALHLTLNVYRHPTENRNFYAPSTEPSLDLPVPVLHISGLDNFELPRPRLVARRLATSQNASGNSGSGPEGGYMGKDFRAAYVPDSPRDGSGQMLGLLEFDGYSASDINDYEAQAGLPNVPLQNVLIDGASGGPQDPQADVEVALDIEVAISMATNLSRMVVYIAPDGEPFEDILNSMVLSNQVKQFSCSWYVPDGTAEPAADQIWEQMAAQGQSFFNASGDSCAYTGLIPFPGDSPYITQVGGTTLSTTGPGGAWSSETVWNWGTEMGPEYNGIGSSGGVSTQYPIPSWQTNISAAANQGSTTMRNTPDVAMTADNVYVRVDGGDYYVGGTSCAAPLWAGFAALVNQQAAASGKPSVGFINPALGAIGTGPSYTSDFHDITTGNNTWSGSPSKFYAVTGYDLCTGWGTPAGQKLINDLANPEALVILPANGFVSTGGVGGPFTVTSEELSLTNAGTNVLTWTVANTSLWLNVSSSEGTLLPGGPATLVTVTLNNTASNLAVGTYSATLWFTNVNDGYGQGVSYALNVIAPPTIISQPTNQAVLEGMSAMFTVSATGGLPLSYQWQLNGANLPDRGNIMGSQTANLAVSDVSDADVGNYTVTVANLAGVAVSSNATLSIIPSAPVITVQPTNETAVVGQTAVFIVSAVGNRPILYQWSFNGTNIIGATNSVYLLPDIQLTNGGAYSVLLTNELGSAASSNVVLTVLPTPPCDPAPSDIVAWWPGDGNLDDIIGSNNGVVTNGTVGFAPAEVGLGFDFNGGPNRLIVPDSPPLDIGSNVDFTIEGWIRAFPTNTPQGVMSIIDKRYAPNSVQCQGYEVCLFNGQMNLRISDDPSGNGSSWNAGPNLLDGQLHHIAVTVTRDSTNGGNFYVDGTNVLQFDPTSVEGDLTTTQPLRIGNHPDPTYTAFFDGQIDELSLYKRALSANEIAAIYQAASAGKCPPAPIPPVILIQPTNQTVAVDETASFSVVAGGTQLSYQWSFDGTELTGATNATLTLTDVQFSQAGTYAVVVSNVYGSTVSSNATLTVYGAPPFIMTQPTNETVVVDGTASFSVAAGGTAPLSYQWSFDGTNLTGATNATLTMTNVQFSHAGTYEVEITNAYGSTNSANAVLSVYGVPPFITTQPTNQTVIAGGTATFSVTAGSSVPLSYQWTFDGTSITGATNSVLTLTNVQPGEAGTYEITITNAYGSTNSIPATLAVNSGSCDPVPSGIVAWWPGDGNFDDIIGTNNGTVTEGTVGFAPAEVGLGFDFNGGANRLVVPDSPALDIGSNVDFTIEGWIRAFPGNTPQGVMSIVDKRYAPNSIQCQGYEVCLFNGQMNLRISDDPSGNGQSWSAGPNLLDGQLHHIAVTVVRASTNASNFYVDGTNILQFYTTVQGDLTTSQPLLIGNHPDPEYTAFFDGEIDEFSLYKRALSSNEIAAIYRAASAGKCLGAPPYITVQPTNLTVSAANNAVFSVAAGGTTPLSYQWTFNGSNSIPGATNSALVLTNVQFANEGSYSVTVTNLYGSIISSNALLIVTVDHFAWNTIPSPRFVNSPFEIAIVAQDATNGVFTNYAGVVFIGSTNGVPVSPTASSYFVNGVWMGTIAVSQTATNLVLSASDGSGHAGLANPINVINQPQLTSTPYYGTLYISWPTNPAGFVLETSTNLASGTWHPVTTAPLQLGGLYLQPITPTGTNASVFYRLQFSGP